MEKVTLVTFSIITSFIDKLVVVIIHSEKVPNKLAKTNAEHF